MRNSEVRSFSFSPDGNSIFRVNPKPIKVSTAPDLPDQKPPVNPIRKKNFDYGQYTFDVGIDFLGTNEQIAFHIPKSEIDGVDLPAIVFPDGLKVIHPQLNQECWDRAWAEYLPWAIEEEARQIAAYNRYLNRFLSTTSASNPRG